MSAPDALARANRRLAAVLFSVGVVMFVGGYALVPMYEGITELAGINGKTGRADAQTAAASQVDSSRWVTVEFTGQAMGGMPWEFRPLQKKIRLHPGETAGVKYYARNTAAETITGRAVASVTPGQAAVRFKLVECFCFNRQALGAGEGREMVARFLVEANLPEEVKTLTLSYAFFNVERSRTNRPASSGG